MRVTQSVDVYPLDAGGAGAFFDPLFYESFLPREYANIWVRAVGRLAVIFQLIDMEDQYMELWEISQMLTKDIISRGVTNEE